MTHLLTRSATDIKSNGCTLEVDMFPLCRKRQPCTKFGKGLEQNYLYKQNDLQPNWIVPLGDSLVCYFVKGYVAVLEKAVNHVGPNVASGCCPPHESLEDSPSDAPMVM